MGKEILQNWDTPMADFHTLIDHAKPDWPAEWRFVFAEFCELLLDVPGLPAVSPAAEDASSLSTTEETESQCLPSETLQTSL